MWNVNEPLAVTERASPPLSSRTSPDPARPLTPPPTVNALVVQVTVTDVTLPLTTLPVAPATVQIWLGPVGCVFTFTS